VVRALLVAALGSQVSGCVLELGTELACGDGYVDRTAGEECDIAVEASYIGICRTEYGYDVPGVCDPQTCRVDREACFPEPVEPDPPHCFNGKVEVALGEECDPDLASIVTEVPEVDCSDLPSPSLLPYAGGVSLGCLDDCTYDRTFCHWCGDGSRRTEEPFAEKCDGQDYAPADQADYCLTNCPTSGAAGISRVWCDARCKVSCDGFEAPGDALECCLLGMEPVTDGIECCFGVDPNDASRCALPEGG
jgi:hypothetical protein